MNNTVIHGEGLRERPRQKLGGGDKRMVSR